MSDATFLKTLQSFIGQADGGTRSCPYAINDAMIHHWCDAIGDRNASYLEPEFAKASVHKGIVAPPTMLQAWTMSGLTPTAPTAESAKTDQGDEKGPKSVLEVLDDAGFTSVVATDCEQEYFRYLKPGDRITHDVEIEAVSSEKKTALGVGHFVTQRYRYRDASGELVGEMRFKLLKFRPPTESRPIIGPRIPGGRPRPSLNQDMSFFWEGAAKGQLLIQRCTSCHTLRHPPGPGCPKCSSMEWQPAVMSGKGEIYSFVRHHHPPIPPFETGHAVLLVQLDEGPRLISELVEENRQMSQITIGMRVEVQFDEVEEGFIMPRFRIIQHDQPDGTDKS